MACPYFCPGERHPADWGGPAAILPLGDAWTGTCHASTGTPRQPEESELRPLCYFGYARGRCGHFPEQDPGPDATRFCIASDDGASLSISWVQERDHHPYAHGVLHYSLAASGLAPMPAGETLARQAVAYVESYRRRKNEAFAR